MGMSSEEVLFRKGPPSQKNEVYWTYAEGNDSVGHVVGIKDGKVRFSIAFKRIDDYAPLPTLQGINGLSSLEEVTAKFGEPDAVSVSKDGTKRHVNFSKYGVTFQLQRNKVISLGVFDPKVGTIEYASEPASSTSR